MLLFLRSNACRRLFAKPGGPRRYSTGAFQIGGSSLTYAGGLCLNITIWSLLGTLMGRIICGPPSTDEEIIAEVLSEERFHELAKGMKEMEEAERIHLTLLGC